MVLPYGPFLQTLYISDSSGLDLFQPVYCALAWSCRKGMQYAACIVGVHWQQWRVCG
jgi:hypothetical protein